MQPPNQPYTENKLANGLESANSLAPSQGFRARKKLGIRELVAVSGRERVRFVLRVLCAYRDDVLPNASSASG
jgi:hypothetical protein